MSSDPTFPSDEKIYFDDLEFLVTSKRFLLRKSGETLLISSLSNPRIETSGYFHETFTHSWIGHIFRVIGDEVEMLFNRENRWNRLMEWMYLKIQVNQIDRRILEVRYSHPWADSDFKGDSPEVKKLRSEYLKLSEALGAAIAGV